MLSTTKVWFNELTSPSTLYAYGLTMTIMAIEHYELEREVQSFV